MQYSEGRTGRVFTVRIDNGEDFIMEIQRFVAAMNIQNGMIHFLGAVREAKMVTGPKEPVIPPVPRMEDLFGGWELFGFATIYPGEDGPAVHIHAAAGRGIRSLTGCIRERAVVYLIIEAIVTEFVDISARRLTDEGTGVSLPVFDQILP
jgi:predicted DNA-binding protein with PD1-like motif